jgi:hypothetical protein
MYMTLCLTGAERSELQNMRHGAWRPSDVIIQARLAGCSKPLGGTSSVGGDMEGTTEVWAVWRGRECATHGHPLSSDQVRSCVMHSKSSSDPTAPHVRRVDMSLQRW